jgi:aspartate racemase
LTSKPKEHGRSGACLGLIGGIGVGATVHYYRQLAKAHEHRGSVLQLLMAHADLERVLEHVRAGERLPLAHYLAGLIRRLQAGGAQVAAVPAVAPHFCARELITISPLPVVNLLEAVASEVRARGIRKAAVFGTRFTVETSLFGQLQGIEIAMPKPQEIDFIHNTYVQLAQTGKGTEEQYRGLTALATTLCERDGAESIILAGTDLALLFDETNADFPCIDCARVHIGAIMCRLFGGAVFQAATGGLIA